MKRTLSGLVTCALIALWVLVPERGASHITTTNTVQFDREVVAILDAHCVACHSPGNLAPSFVTYEETWLDRGPILASVLGRHMPPWAAVPGYGEFSNANSLTIRETQFLVSWVEGLGPRNGGAVFLNVRDPGAAPEPVHADADFSVWSFAEPDLEFELPASRVEPGQGERIERKTVDLELESDVRVSGLEYRPGDRRGVHAAAFRLATTRQWLGTWTPWHGFVSLPEGLAFELPAGSQISAEIYYGTTSEAVVDEGTIGLDVADGLSRALAPDLILEASGPMAPRSSSVRFHAETTIPSETGVLALWPELDSGIESIEVSVRRADGGTDILLFAENIPAEWPTPYLLAEPWTIEAGSRLRVTAYARNETDAVQTGGVRLTVSRF